MFILNEIPVVLHTMDKYSEYWNTWWHFFTKHCFHKNIIFLSEEKTPDFADKIINIKTGRGEWGERLLKGLSMIESELIFYSQEDFWPIEEFPFDQKSIDMFEIENLDCLRISWPCGDYQLTKVREDIYKYNQKFCLDWSSNLLVESSLKFRGKIISILSSKIASKVRAAFNANFETS